MTFDILMLTIKEFICHLPICIQTCTGTCNFWLEEGGHLLWNHYCLWGINVCGFCGSSFTMNWHPQELVTKKILKTLIDMKCEMNQTNYVYVPTDFVNGCTVCQYKLGVFSFNKKGILCLDVHHQIQIQNSKIGRLSELIHCVYIRV